MIFSLSSAEVNWSLEFGPGSSLIEVRKRSTEKVVYSIELPLSVWNTLERQRLRFMDEALTGAPLTREQQQRPNEVHENPEVPGIQDTFRGCEDQEGVVDNVCTSDFAVTMSPIGTSGNETTPTSPNIFVSAVNRYGFGYLCLMKTTVTDLILMLATIIKTPILKPMRKKMQKVCHP